MMKLKEYFEKADGIGILATCDPASVVDLAIYSKPFVIDAQTVAFVMKQRLSHQNLKANIQAAYMFIEQGGGFKGLRMYLTMLREEKNQSLIETLRQKQPCIYPAEDNSEKFLVFFRVDRLRPLIGDTTFQLGVPGVL